MPHKIQPFYLELKELFEHAHRLNLFPDGKVWADAVPRFSIEIIRTNYNNEKSKPNFVLMDFILQYFDLPASRQVNFNSNPNESVNQHIKRLWPFLKRQGDKNISSSSLIPLPYPYIVPGGRFNEIYYWDSYFTMLGLKIHGEHVMIKNMIENFNYLIQSFGHIPNGNRSYFLSRSQPPFFSLMIDLLTSIEGESVYPRYLPSLVAEYNFWMESKDEATHVITLENKQQLNRYFDRSSDPREEMYHDDVSLAKDTDLPSELFSNLRAACESGWDFSTRWLKDGKSLTSINTLEIIPVDLNCLLFHLESTIEKAYQLEGNEPLANHYNDAAKKRKQLIVNILWNEETQCFMDYNYVLKKHTGIIAASMLFPLFFKIASQQQAEKTSNVAETHLLKSGGMVTTTIESGQQWDAPNGWAPLQWMAVVGLKNYGYNELANVITKRWLSLIDTVFKKTGKLLEKYNVVDLDKEGGGGEYPVQDGFGWTNGVYVALAQLNTNS